MAASLESVCPVLGLHLNKVKSTFFHLAPLKQESLKVVSSRAFFGVLQAIVLPGIVSPVHLTLGSTE